tara:strand:+ start:898 stop:1317 length:420 start_codon:yes stop_codon:yes gene_type:complete
MAKKRGRGGYRRPTPTRKNAVSGPGALSQRTDGAQPVMRLPNAEYGESKAFEEQQQAAPLGDSGGAMAPLPMAGPGGSSPNVFAPTENPGEPITAGAPVGPGTTPPPASLYDDVDILLSALYSVNPHPVIAELINTRSI